MITLHSSGREQGWRSGESTRFPPMWPGFDSWSRCHMWVEFVVGSICGLSLMLVLVLAPRVFLRVLVFFPPYVGCVRCWFSLLLRGFFSGYSGFFPSSETQGQLVGTTGFSWAKVYNKSGRAPGHLLLPNEFLKRLKSRLLIGQKIFFLANQRRGTAGDSHVFLHEVVFLINRRSSVARSTGTFLRRASEKKINTK